MGILAWFCWAFTLAALIAGVYYYLKKAGDIRWSQRATGIGTGVIIWAGTAIFVVALVGEPAATQPLSPDTRDPIAPEVFGLGQALDPMTVTIYGGVLMSVLLFVVALVLRRREVESAAQATRLAGIPIIRPFIQPWVLSCLVFGAGFLTALAGTIAFALGLAHHQSTGAAFTTQSELDAAMLIFLWIVTTVGAIIAVMTIVAWPLQHYRILRSRIEYEQLCEGLGLVPGTPRQPATARQPVSKLHVGGLK